MGKLRFPKEKPEVTQKLEGALKLLGQADVDAQTFLQAYNVISECADAGSARADFIRASLLYADEPEEGQYREDILSLLSTAEKGKYPLAAGLKIDYLSSIDENGLLYDAIRKNKGDAPSALYHEGGLWAGLWDAPKGQKINYAKAADCFERSAREYLEYDRAYRAGCRELSDVAICNRDPDYFTSQAAYAYQMLLYVYVVAGAKENVPKYVAAYENAQRYGNAVVRYKTAATRASDCMDNVLGMHSLKTVNSVLKTAKEAYAQLEKARRDELEENYQALWEQYDEFYENEIERLEAIGSMEVYTSADYARQDSLLSDLANAAQHWAATQPSKTEYTVKVGNQSYRVNELGEMVDEYGQRNGLRVDVTSKRVYDERNDAVGFFDSFGEFHKY